MKLLDNKVKIKFMYKFEIYTYNYESITDDDRYYVKTINIPINTKYTKLVPELFDSVIIHNYDNSVKDIMSLNAISKNKNKLIFNCSDSYIDPDNEELCMYKKYIVKINPILINDCINDGIIEDKYKDLNFNKCKSLNIDDIIKLYSLSTNNAIDIYEYKNRGFAA